MYYGRFLYMDTPMADTPIPRHFGNCQKIHLRWGVLSDNSDIRISRTRYSCLTTNYSTISPFISFIIYYLLYIIYTPPSSLLSPLSHLSIIQYFFYLSPTLLKFNFNSTPSLLHYYNLYHSPQFPLYLSLHF